MSGRSPASSAPTPPTPTCSRRGAAGSFGRRPGRVEAGSRSSTTAGWSKDTLSGRVSFRRRLIVTVILIVIVPIGALALLLVQLTGEERSGKADARVAGALPPVLSIFRADLAKARSEARKVARSP